MSAVLGRLTVEGFRSIRHVELDLTTDVTVLIGANGSGKSNLVSVLELVSRIWDDSFQEYLRRHGGVSNLFSKTMREQPSAFSSHFCPSSTPRTNEMAIRWRSRQTR